MQDISSVASSWNQILYGWPLNQIGKTLIVVPDLNHWLSIEKDFEKLKKTFPINKFASQVESKGVTDIIFKATDATTRTGEQYVDKTAEFWYWLGGEMNLRRGAYHWLQYSVDPTVAWNYYRKFLDSHPCEWPHIMDFEEPSVTNASDYIWRAQTWFEKANADMGDRKALCYTGLWYIDKLKSILINSGEKWVSKLGWLHTQPLWLAVYSRYWPTVYAQKYMRYRVYDNKPLWPWSEDEMAGWQYTARAHFPYEGYNTGESGRNWGFDGDGLDINFFKKDWLDANVMDSGNNNPLPPPIQDDDNQESQHDGEVLAEITSISGELDALSVGLADVSRKARQLIEKHKEASGNA